MAIENLPGLHKAIGKYLAEKPGILTGDEFRFLRNELNISQKHFGSLFALTDQAVATWEKGKVNLPQWADRTIRIMYLEFIGERNKNLTSLIEFLNTLDVQERKDLTLKEVGNEWTVTPQAA